MMQARETLLSTEQIIDFSAGNHAFREAGGFSGIKILVTDFYRILNQLPSGKSLSDLSLSELKQTQNQLARFLAGWLGGPSLLQDNQLSSLFPTAHKYLPKDRAQRDAWLTCMRQAIYQQPYNETFKLYLIQQFEAPVEQFHLTY